MSGSVTEFDKNFIDIHGNVVGKLPPLHPHCCCVVFYHRVLPHGLNDLTTLTMTTPNIAPYLLGRIDPSDLEMITAVIRHYEERIVQQPIENAIIITTSREVCHTTGDKNSVDPILMLGDKLNGAVVTHNHPKNSVGGYSFSDDDTDLFKDFNLDRLRGIDEKFLYELNRNPKDSDFPNTLTAEEMADMMATTVDSAHFSIVITAQSEGLGVYRRWQHE